jgi:glutamate transport system substrate-binding protein
MSRIRRAAAVAVAGAIALTGAAACGKSKTDTGGGGDTKSKSYEVVKSPKFAAGSTMDKLNKAGKITIGVKFDQPGIGEMNAATGKPAGFDIEIGKIIAGQLGISADKVEWKEAISKNRQPFIENGTVDLVIASYSITDDRKKVVGFAGPYYVTGQQLLVRKADKAKIKSKDDLAGKKVCSVTGSTPLAYIQQNYPTAQITGLATYTECVDQLRANQVDVVTTDGAILLGYAAKFTDTTVVGQPFTTEKYGIGLKKDDTAFRNWLDDTLSKVEKDGTWKKAYDTSFSKTGIKAPKPPALERY